MFLKLILERERKGDVYIERNINDWLPLARHPLGMEPATETGASALLVHGLVLNH